VREARFPFAPDGSRDGGVHALFVIRGHPDAAGCNIVQEDFEKQVRDANIVFRIPSPVFGAGLIEAIPDTAIVANLNANEFKARALGISGRPNRNGNDGTISRFGWKAQNQSLLLFSAEAYNVEMGITNELFQVERDATASCSFATTPNDVTPSVRHIGAIENFANFQRFLAAPQPAPSFSNVSVDSVRRGREVFDSIGCALCHTPSLTTGDASVTALSTRGPICSPIWRSTPWGPRSPTTSFRAPPPETSSEPLRSGVSASGSSSCTTGGRRTWSTQSAPIGARRTRSSGPRRLTP
jgi:hypothetical protein